MKDIAYYKKGAEKNGCLKKSVFVPDDENGDETLFTLSNGYMGIRGALELGGSKRDAATFIAGLYDKKEVPEVVSSRGYVKNKAITPAYAIVPDCNLSEVSADGMRFDFINGKVVSFERTLDMKRGFTVNEYVLQNACGKRLSVKTLSFVSKKNLHFAGFRTEITPLNFDGKLTVTLKNSLRRDPQFIRRLKDYVCKTELISAEETDGVCEIEAEVTETKEKIFLFSKSVGDGERYALTTGDGIDEVFCVDCENGKTYSFEKRAEYYTSHDDVPPEFSDDGFSAQLEAHIAEWAKFWDAADVVIDGDDELQAGLRWNIFNLIQLAAPHDPNVSISATGLHGQGYFGHIFWDTEIFLIPFYLATDPEAAKSLLLYRYNRLAGAKKAAAAENCRGAKFPWTSAYTGEDVTPPDWAASSKREIHIAGAVAYAMYNYYVQTGDFGFYKDYGIETVVETAEYYVSRSNLGADGKYHISDVTGPDEYNIHVNDNYYTNFLAVWNMREALSAMEDLKKTDKSAYDRIAKAAGFDAETAKEMKRVADGMAFPKARDGVLEQFDGFFGLKDTGGFARDGYGMPLDRKRVFDSGIQELKQPDVVMTFYLFPAAFSEETQKINFEYYEKRCKHGSSLSPSVHCVVGLRNGFSEHAYGYLYLTAMLDPKNLHMDKNLYEGVHIACAGGTWGAAVYGFGGVRIENGELNIDPKLPEKWSGLSFKFLNRGVRFSVGADKNGFTVCADKDARIFVKGKSYALEKGKERRFGAEE